MQAPPPRLRELGAAFLRVGLTSFGGPLVAMGLIHREAVERRRWVTPQWFAETLGLVEAVPGPSATEMAISVGVAKRGRAGGIVAGLAYVLPGFFIIVGLAAAYFHFGRAPLSERLLGGLKPATMAVLTAVCWRLSRAVVKDRMDAVLLLGALAACLAGASVAATILAAGLLRLGLRGRTTGAAAAALPVFLLGAPGGAAKLPILFAGTLKAGALVTGGGYVIASFLSSDFVDRLGWLTREEFLAGLALAQFKPGPIILLSAFIGYKAAGVLGAAVAATGAFLPCFGTLLAVGPAVEKLRGGPRLSIFLRGMGAASVGSIAAVAVQLAPEAVRGVPAFLLYAAGLAALAKLEPVWILAGSAALGATAGL